MKCEKCDREFSEDECYEYPGKLYVHKGEVICEDCLGNMGVSLREAYPYSAYRENHSGLVRY